MKIYVATLLVILSPLVQALTVDAALITQLHGEVTVDSPTGGKRPAVALLKLAAGEKLHLSSGSRMQLVFFESARQEFWSGSGSIEIGDNLGRSSTLKPEIRQLPALLAKHLTKTPAAGPPMRAGMVVVRSLSTQRKIERLEEQYAEFRRDLPVDDLTPELFYLNGLIELNNYDRARAVLSALKERQNDAAAQAAVAHYFPLVEAKSSLIDSQR